MKICASCQQNLSEDFFNKKKKGLQPYCKSCQSQHQKNWYAQNKEIRAKQIKSAQRKRIAYNVERLNEIKSRPCADCGVKYNPWQMDFDHLRDKNYYIGYAVHQGTGLASLMKEIQKCDVVCANCHRNRTHFRKQGLLV